ncbi:glyoxalase/bleomycin resistance/extradiol dioxygenase family protein [Paenibacillus oenotherae]|uniref:Glyoxalase/bleomycin resistance/extradiol dioxygenase family protein n=1 Tax=Paenibacillus oenotherae TaxID=1435645 RepID=A0ABS7D774_9BACL|nr:VOC family protein [Paenibacillus oenotherae]MBW7475725.1 glyoxalase/bleomycin resistance/extradiol dioxygenase family protein [Paenibacillus oenotherae]
MNVSGFYPVILTDQVVSTAAFYEEHFGFTKVFEADWYISLKMLGKDRPFELAVLDASHPTIPGAYRTKVKGLILNIEVDDVDAEYERLIRGAKLPLELDIRSEDFGQRHFITSDPSGVLIDVITVIPPSNDFSAQYSEEVWK